MAPTHAAGTADMDLFLIFFILLTGLLVLVVVGVALYRYGADFSDSFPRRNAPRRWPGHSLSDLAPASATPPPPPAYSHPPSYSSAPEAPRRLDSSSDSSRVPGFSPIYSS